MPSHSPPEMIRKRVLLVEDDSAVRRALQLLLFSHGYEVRAYPSGTGLAHDPEAMRADCLVADLIIPDGDAITLLNDMRRAGWTGQAVLISGYLNSEREAVALATGYAAAFSKPIGDAVLINCLSQLLAPRNQLPSRNG
jgi:two-component system response regulator FixJ